MRDVRYKIELEKFKKEKLFSQELEDSKEKIVKKDLYRYRYQLKELILHVVSGKETIKLIETPDEMKFLKEYRNFSVCTKNLYPKFIFDEFDINKFKKCIELKEIGYTLTQIEDYYVNVLCEKNKFVNNQVKIISK